MTRLLLSLSLTTMILSSCWPEPKSSKNKSVQQSKVNKDLTMLQTNDTIDLSSFEKTDSKILYKITQEGTGDTPVAGELVTVHYTGWLLNGENQVGTKFDSSRDRGDYFQFPVLAGYVIAGWDEMVSEMKVGERRTVVLPPNMAYGSRGAGASIPPNATLIFDIELFKSS